MQARNTIRVKSYFYGRGITFLNPINRILKKCVFLPVKLNTVLPQISTEAGLDSSSSKKKEKLLKKHPPKLRKHAIIEQTGISQCKFNS